MKLRQLWCLEVGLYAATIGNTVSRVQAAAGRMLYNTPEMDKGGTDDNGTAAILEGTQLCCTCQLRDILHCLGGVSVLLPLVNQLGSPPCPPRSSLSNA